MVINGNALYIPLATGSVHCIVTSPPYWGLRDYGTATWQGGDEDCKHNPQKPDGGDRSDRTLPLGRGGLYRDACGKCGAVRIDNQLGLERTPEEYVANMVAVFRECWRVLRDDGTLWLNLGDSYSSGGRDDYHSDHRQFGNAETRTPKDSRPQTPPGLKPKDLVGIPWRVAFALQADGWYLRSDVIWSKPNPMPESVTDRPTKSHEYLFLLAKGKWKSTIVKYSDLPCQRFHFSDYFRPGGFTVRGSARLPIDLATAIFDYSQRQYNFSLPPFYSEIWEQSDNNRNSDFISSLPVEHWPAIWAARFLTANITTENFFSEIDRFWIAHSNSDHFLKRWTFPPTVSDAPSITSDGEGTITIHYPGEICKIDFISHKVIISRPGGGDYYYDAEAIKEDAIYGENLPSFRGNGGYTNNRSYENSSAISAHTAGIERPKITSRNRRTVWTIPTAPYSGAHFATFPPALVEPCIKAGTSERGVCPKCGKPWKRISETSYQQHRKRGDWENRLQQENGENRSPGMSKYGVATKVSTTTGWLPTCICDAGSPIPALVFDPFAGSGTTIKVAYDLGRRGIGLDLSMAYLTEQATTRIHNGHTARLL